VLRGQRAFGFLVVLGLEGQRFVEVWRRSSDSLCRALLMAGSQ